MKKKNPLRIAIIATLAVSGICHADGSVPRLIIELVPGAQGKALARFVTGEANGQPAVYFEADPVYPDYNAWVTDGTAAGTRQVMTANVTSQQPAPGDGA